MQANVKAGMEAERCRQQEQLKKERSALEKHRGDLTRLPTRKERAEVDAAEAVVEQLRKDVKSKDARHKLTVERMRRQVVTLQVWLVIGIVSADFSMYPPLLQTFVSCVEV